MQPWVVFCDSHFQDVFYTAELSTSSLGDFVVFGNYDFHTVSTQVGLFWDWTALVLESVAILAEGESSELRHRLPRGHNSQWEEQGR